MRGGFLATASPLFKFMYSEKVFPQELSRETHVFWGFRPSSSLDAFRPINAWKVPQLGRSCVDSSWK